MLLLHPFSLSLPATSRSVSALYLSLASHVQLFPCAGDPVYESIFTYSPYHRP